MWDKLDSITKGISGAQQVDMFEEISNQAIREKHKRLSSNPLKVKTLAQFARIVDIEIETGARYPLQKGQVIFADLVGIGDVLDEPHFVIVWDCDTANGHVVVIPMTSNKFPPIALTPFVPSFQTRDKFNIGIIEGVKSSKPNVESIVKISQIQSISWKSVHILKKKDPSTGADVEITLSPDQLRHVEDLFYWQYSKQPLLRDLLVNNLKMIPTNPPVEYETLLYRPVIAALGSSGSTLYFKANDDKHMRSLQLVSRISGVNFRDYKGLLNDICSKQQSTRLRAQTALQGHLNRAASSLVAATVPGGSTAASGGLTATTPAAGSSTAPSTPGTP